MEDKAQTSTSPSSRNEVSRVDNYRDTSEDADGEIIAEAEPERWWICLPDSTFRRRWDIAQSFILLYVSLVVPFRVGFKLTANGGIYVWELFIDMYFYVDIYLNFTTGFYDDSLNLILDPVKIARNYAQGWLSIDLVACLPLDLVQRLLEKTFVCSFEGGCDEQSSGSGQLLRLFKLLRLFRLMKLLRLMRLSRIFERYQDDLFQYMYLLSVGKLFVLLLYLGHILSCFFFYFSTQEWRTSDEEDQTLSGEITPWVYANYHDEDTDAENVTDRYIATMYWAFTTMTTVGYGDISATTRAERVFAIFGMILGGFVFSGIISTMSDVMQSANLSQRAHDTKMESVSAFIRDAELTPADTKAVLSYFRQQEVKAYDQRTLLKELPYELRYAILEHNYGNIIVKASFFDINGDNKVDDHVFVTELCTRLRRVSFTKNCVIFQRGEIGTCMYIISSGLVDVMDLKLAEVITVLECGSYFGEGGVLGNHKRQENIRARTLCELCKLDLEDLEVMLISYPHLYKDLVKTYNARQGVFSPDRQTIKLNDDDDLYRHVLSAEAKSPFSPALDDAPTKLALNKLEANMAALTEKVNSELTAINQKLSILIAASPQPGMVV
ncbi:hypothetical protein CYMTET_31011 [Cymbomonas tetramitiformis]|uniref:Cyclic nucleotide-binding domain-containing protein n=1 Tax=Cymbomonas tetramitiformis TaxID=36881 RepID=A0AAE0FHZ0_9CHLO|nr:hypothetical protein CYMTET_31011 [Cymbomonas tetramitiformis]